MASKTNVSALRLSFASQPDRLSIEEWLPLIPASAIVARQRYRLASVKCDTPLLMLPIEGQKQLNYAGESYVCNPTEYLMLHGAADVSVENIPIDKGIYRAWIIAFPWRVIELARQLILGSDGSVRQKSTSCLVSQHPLPPKLFQVLGRYLRQLQELPSQAEIELSLISILVALHADGASGFLTTSNPSLTSRVRMMVSGDPQHDWCSGEFEEAFHVSGATLRRRLAAENTTLRALVREARLLAALSLLQTSSRPIKTIAIECGYQSLSSFRENFIEQFGVSPSEIGSA